MSQLDLLQAATAPIRVPVGAHEPRFWVRRLCIWSAPGELVREIELRPGLNIVWSPDPADSPGPDPTALGHGAGKTLFCRLLRFCLGETRFAPAGLRDDIASAFPDGVVGAEVVVDGMRWAVARTIGMRRRHVASSSVSLNDLASGEPGGNTDEFVAAVVAAFVTVPVAALLPGYRPDRGWLLPLAWLARDQECRFGGALRWRDAASESDSPARDLSAGERLEVVRALLGALSPDELAARSELSDLLSHHGRFESDVTHHRWQERRLRASLLRELELDDGAVMPGAMGLGELRQRVATRFPGAGSSPANDIDDDGLAGAREVRDTARSEHERLDHAVAQGEGRLGALEKMARTLRASLPGLSADQFAAEHPVCDVCEVPIDLALATQCKLSNERHDVAKMKERLRLRREEVTDAEADVVRLKKDLTVDRVERDAARKVLDEREAQVRSLERARDEVNTTRRRVMRLQDDIVRLGDAIAEGQVAAERVLETSSAITSMRERIQQLRLTQAAGFAQFDQRFADVVRRLAGAAAKGSAKVTGRGLELRVAMGGVRRTAAIESMKVLAFDLAAMILAIEGGVHLPAFLVHDSPREADLGPTPYGRVFELARGLETLTGTPMFQYIVTTTTRPPDAVAKKPWLVETLRGGPAEARLLKRDLAGSEDGRADGVDEATTDGAS